MIRPRLPADFRGFTLTELAVVLLVVGLLMGSVIGSYSTMAELGKYNDAQSTLNTARDALLGFAAANGRLPCPAVDGTTPSGNSGPPKYGPAGVNSYGVEWPSGGGTCTVVASSMPGLGYVPAATLGLTPVDNQGFLLDPWGNRVLYAVTSSGTNYDFTTQGALRTALTDALPSTPAPDLRICTTTPITNPGTTTAVCASNAQTLTNSAAAVLISIGKNGVTSYGNTGADEVQNLHNPGSLSYPWTTKDRVYISHPPAPVGATYGEYDDIVLWIAPALVYNRIMSGGI